MIVSSVLRVSSMSTSVRAAGTAMAMRMTTGMSVQMISTLVLCTRLVSATAPFDLRNATSDQIIQPKTTTPMPTQIQKTSMCRS